jgi:hypothetical protein
MSMCEGILDRGEDRRLGDFVELKAFGLLHVKP